MRKISLVFRGTGYFLVRFACIVQFTDCEKVKLALTIHPVCFLFASFEDISSSDGMVAERSVIVCLKLHIHPFRFSAIILKQSRIVGICRCILARIFAIGICLKTFPRSLISVVIVIVDKSTFHLQPLYIRNIIL